MGWLTPEHRHEPEMALAAGEDGMSVARRILAEGRDHLTPRGGMLAEVGRLRPAVEAEAPDLPLLWIDTEQSRGETFWISAEAWSAASSAESARKAAGAGKPRPARKPPKS